MFVERSAVILMSGVDSGGSVGVQMALFVLNQRELNGKLHQTTNFPFQSHGDLKHFIIQSLGYRRPEIPWSNYLDFRSYHLSEHITQYLEFSHFLSIDPKLSQEFLGYLQTFFAYFVAYQEQLPTSKPICLGNLLLSFWQYKAGHINNLTDFLQHLSLIPPWVEFVFLSVYRTHLQGYDADNHLVQGEHLFDEWPQAILPHTHTIHNDDSDTCLINPRLLEILENLSKTDRVIIPPGSDSNWIGILNQRLIRQKLQNRTIFWLANLFRFTSETTLMQTLLHLNSLKIHPQMYLPNPDFLDLLFQEQNLTSLRNYVLQERKIPQVVYLPKYRTHIRLMLDKLRTLAGAAEYAANMLDVLDRECHTLVVNLDLEEHNHIHHDAVVQHLDGRYVHDPVYAQAWLELLG